MALNELVFAAKKIVYSKTGEPYRVNGQTLRFVPGYRPVRTRYANSDNRVSRYDALEILYFSSRVKPGDVAIDIGAHGGQYALLLSALCGPSGKVVAFEPDPHARAIFLRNIALNPKIRAPHVEPLAVSDKTGESVLFSKGGNSQSSLVRTGVDHNPDSDVEEISVKTTTLDDYGLMAKWVKIDVEGAEIGALRGAKKLLASDANFLVELHPYAWPEFGVTFADLQAIVAESGRRMRYLDEVEPLTGEPIYGVVALER